MPEETRGRLWAHECTCLQGGEVQSGHVSVGTYLCSPEVCVNSLEVEFQKVVSLSIWKLGNKFRASGVTASTISPGHTTGHTHSDPSDLGSLTYTITHTLPVSHTQSPSVSPARLGVTAQRPSHTFARARPPPAPCHPQSRADTVQNTPPFPAAPRCSRTEAPPSRPAAGLGVRPSFPGSTDP